MKEGEQFIYLFSYTYIWMIFYSLSVEIYCHQQHHPQQMIDILFISFYNSIHTYIYIYNDIYNIYRSNISQKTLL